MAKCIKKEPLLENDMDAAALAEHGITTSDLPPKGVQNLRQKASVGRDTGICVVGHYCGGEDKLVTYLKNFEPTLVTYNVRCFFKGHSNGIAEYTREAKVCCHCKIHHPN